MHNIILGLLSWVVLNAISLCLWLISATTNSQMDNVDNKYSSSMYPKIAIWLHKLRLFKTLDGAETWFNKNKEGWTLAYYNRIKDNSKPHQNKVRWKVWFIEFNKPSLFVDAWHWFKFWLVVVFIPLTIITHKPLLVFNHWYYNLPCELFIYSSIWFIWFELTLNKK